MPNTTDFQAIFAELKPILARYAERLIVTEDGPAGYSLNTPYSEKHKKEVFFGAVQIKKNYVSFHLMPVYMFPDLLADISPALRKRMQGNACFNFKTSDPALFRELARLTRRSVERVRRAEAV